MRKNLLTFIGLTDIKTHENKEYNGAVEQILHKYNFEKCTSKSELCIGLPLEYRCHAFNYESWKKENIIDFLSCLFNTILEEGEYKQQDLWEELLVA